MKTKLKLSPKVSTKNILVYTCTGIVGALLIGIGAFFYFNLGNSEAIKAATNAEPPIIRSTGIGDGSWDDEDSWTPRKPKNGDRVIIEKGHIVTVKERGRWGYIIEFDGDIIVNGELKIKSVLLEMSSTSRVAINIGGKITFSGNYGLLNRDAAIHIGGTLGFGASYEIEADTSGEAYFGDGAEFLPIELLTFNAEMTEAGDVTITWSTASEKNNDFFTIERSIDGQNFFVLDTLAGAGNSNTLREYTYTDPAPVAGYNYYRLKQTDYDGKFEYFDMVTVVNDKAKPELSMISIGPNPYRDQFEVSFYSLDNNAVHLKLLDMKGKTIFSKSLEAEKGLNSFTYFDQKNLQPGIYLFTIVQKGTPAKTFRIVKSS